MKAHDATQSRAASNDPRRGNRDTRCWSTAGSLGLCCRRSSISRLASAETENEHHHTHRLEGLAPGNAWLPFQFVGLMARVETALHDDIQSSRAPVYDRLVRLLSDPTNCSHHSPLGANTSTRRPPGSDTGGIFWCPTERDVLSKTWASDESSMLDLPWMTWAPSWVAARERGLQGHSTGLSVEWHAREPFSIAARANVAFLGVEPNSLRHG